MRKQLLKNSVYATFLFLSNIVFPGALIAQEPTGMLEGFVVNEMGPVSGARIILDIKTEGFRRKSTFVTNPNGSFRIYAQFGKFELTTEYKCVTRTESIEIKSLDPQNLTIVLPSENCEIKAAEWDVCKQQAHTGESAVSDSDKAEILNHVLEGILDQESQQSTIVYGEKEMTISTENIKPEWVKPIRGIKINVFSKEEIKAKADEGGDVNYFLFEKWERKSSCVVFGLVRGFEKGKDSKVISRCLSGAYLNYWYRRIDDSWKRRIVGSFF